jgi:hypothetical protein
MPNLRNLRRRPLAPAKGNGRVQKAIRRAYIMEGHEVLSATEIYDYTHGRRRMERRHLPSGIYRTTRRTLATMADRRGRSPAGSGRPWLWALKDSEK